MNYTLVTGASKGIGKAFAHECAARGMNLILVARSKTLLETLAKELSVNKVSVQTLAVDLLKPDSHKEIFDWVAQNSWNVNMLLNNAGAGYYGKFDEKPLEKHLEVMHLNMDSMIRMAHEFLNRSDKMQKRYLLNTVSTGAFQPTPFMAIYCASKSFMLAFSQAIRFELRKQQVYVTALCPGGTESEFSKPAEMEKVFEKNAQFMMKADVVAKTGLDGLMKNKAVVIPGTVNKVGALAASLFPNKFVVPSAARFFEV